ncbi:MupA/Atu3671 family FMN-dependent luciferase-like monooxygenase [Tahibacter sp.]|uniref:MupA/Atu3671 family FMN-dependent luciferase-like monooxygenase n=1 Tax=Tahibacter sp. TaxID=2056211 RepID=UPI0028C50280|nr:MupA/Atu3671 family FMN-dependent luciferase-like monooxygenase [Tahibacter sp.]
MKFSGFVFAAEDNYAHAERYAFLFKVAEYLDQNGFTALWTPERHFQEFGGSFPNPAVLSAALAARTNQLQIRAGSVVAPHHHSVRIAEEWALVDQISKGRAGVCFATGWHKRDFVFYPENYEKRKEVTFRKIDEVRTLWAGKSLGCPIGNDIVDIRIHPQPVQQQIPLWLVFSSDPSIWTKAGELGLNVLALLNSWNSIEENIARYRDARVRFGHDPAAGIVTVGLHTFIGTDNKTVRKLVEAPLKRYLASFLLAKNDDKKLSSQQAPMTDAERDLILEGAFRDLFDSRSLLGDLEKCGRVVESLERIGVDEVAALIDFGMDFPSVLDSLDNFRELKFRFDSRTAANSVCDEAGADSDFGWYFNR